jgi:capsid protein
MSEPTIYVGSFAGAGGAADGSWSYDAADQPVRGRRKSATPLVGSEDQILTREKRDRLTASSRDLSRNFALVEWMIRRHLDYVATFELHADFGDDAINQTMESWAAEWGRKENFDRSGRHDRDRYLRIAESRSVLDGDFGTARLFTGHVQGVEGDRIRDQKSYYNVDQAEDAARWVNGVKVDEALKAISYSVCRRNLGQWTFEREVPAENLYLHGYFGRYDQVRGVSPLASALNHFRDVYDSIDLALAKAKVSQMFALAILRNADKAAGELEAEEDGGGYNVDFGKGPILLDLEPGDYAKFLSENQPSTEFQAFLMAVLQAALKALDIPYSFYDEAHTNFFGSRGAWLHYERSSLSKRKAVVELLRTLTLWRLKWSIIQGDRRIPSQLSIEQLLAGLNWVPIGMPWWKPTEELRGELDAIAAGLTNFERVARERGTPNPRDNIRINAAVTEYARKAGFPLVVARQGQDQPTINVETPQ